MKTISTEAALRHVLALKTTYDGPDREEFVREIDGFVEDFRKKHGPQIPVDQAYTMLKRAGGSIRPSRVGPMQPSSTS